MNINQWLLARREGRLSALPLGMEVSMASFCDVSTVSYRNGSGYGNTYGYGHGYGNGEGYRYGEGEGHGDGQGEGDGNLFQVEHRRNDESPSLIQLFDFKEKS